MQLTDDQLDQVPGVRDLAVSRQVQGPEKARVEQEHLQEDGGDLAFEWRGATVLLGQ